MCNKMEVLRECEASNWNAAAAMDGSVTSSVVEGHHYYGHIRYVGMFHSAKYATFKCTKLWKLVLAYILSSRRTLGKLRSS